MPQHIHIADDDVYLSVYYLNQFSVYYLGLTEIVRPS